MLISAESCQNYFQIHKPSKTYTICKWFIFDLFLYLSFASDKEGLCQILMSFNNFNLSLFLFDCCPNNWYFNRNLSTKNLRSVVTNYYFDLGLWLQLCVLQTKLNAKYIQGKVISNFYSNILNPAKIEFHYILSQIIKRRSEATSILNMDMTFNY